MALETHRGRKLLQSISRAASAGAWYEPEIAAKRRKLQELTASNSIVDAAQAYYSNIDCYVGNNIPYL